MWRLMKEATCLQLSNAADWAPHPAGSTGGPLRISVEVPGSLGRAAAPQARDCKDFLFSVIL